MNILVIGTGYVGLVTGACLAEMGNHVTCIDNNKIKIKDLKKIKLPIYEPGLEEIVKTNIHSKRLEFAFKIPPYISENTIIFII